MGCAIGSNELARPDSDPCDGGKNRRGFGSRFASLAYASASPPLLDRAYAYRIGSGTGRINRQLVSYGVGNWLIGEVENLRFICTGYAQSSVRAAFITADGLRAPLGER
jgi:hypothetical protein